MRWMLRNWWRFTAVAISLVGIWFLHLSANVDRCRDEEMDAQNANWKRIDQGIFEHVDAYRKATTLQSRADEANRIIELQTENFTRQREALLKSQELYYEKGTYVVYFLVLYLQGWVVIVIGPRLNRRRKSRGCPFVVPEPDVNQDVMEDLPRAPEAP